MPFAFYLVFFVFPLFFLFLFGWKKPRLTWVSIPVCLVIGTVIYWQELLYYEARPFILFFFTILAVVMLMLSLIIMKFRK